MGMILEVFWHRFGGTFLKRPIFKKTYKNQWYYDDSPCQNDHIFIHVRCFFWPLRRGTKKIFVHVFGPFCPPFWDLIFAHQFNKGVPESLLGSKKSCNRLQKMDQILGGKKVAWVSLGGVPAGPGGRGGATGSIASCRN